MAATMRLTFELSVKKGIENSFFNSERARMLLWTQQIIIRHQQKTSASVQINRSRSSSTETAAKKWRKQEAEDLQRFSIATAKRKTLIDVPCAEVVAVVGCEWVWTKEASEVQILKSKSWNSTNLKSQNQSKISAATKVQTYKFKEHERMVWRVELTK